jgi:hypothetical protein
LSLEAELLGLTLVKTSQGLYEIFRRKRVQNTCPMGLVKAAEWLFVHGEDRGRPHRTLIAGLGTPDYAAGRAKLHGDADDGGDEDDFDFEPADDAPRPWETEPRPVSGQARELVITRALSNLPREDEETLRRFFGERMTESSIGRILGVKQPGVSKRIQRICQRLVEAWAKDGIWLATSWDIGRLWLSPEVEETAVQHLADREIEGLYTKAMNHRTVLDIEKARWYAQRYLSQMLGLRW